MSKSIVWRLIAKDLYLYRWLIAGTLLVGLASIFVSNAGGAFRTIAFILVVTCIVALGVFLGIFCVLTERQTRSVLFVLSLPVSPMQYTMAKVAASQNLEDMSSSFSEMRNQRSMSGMDDVNSVAICRGMPNRTRVAESAARSSPERANSSSKTSVT